MGWLYTHKPEGESVLDFFKNHNIYSSNEHVRFKHLKCAVVKGVAYLAIQMTKKAPDGQVEIKVFAEICLLDYQKNTHNNFGYKDMDETSYPYYFDCPASILNLLTETSNENALKWRQACRDMISKKKDTKIAVGTTLQFEYPVSFSDGFAAQVFRVRDVKSGSVSCKTADGSWIDGYKITRLKDKLLRELAKIVPAESVGAL